MLPQAEINTAGVIIAVRTATAEDISSTLLTNLTRPLTQAVLTIVLNLDASFFVA